MSVLLLAGVVGIGVGIVVGTLGAGGGILAVPVLVYLLDFAPHEAAAGSLVIVLVTALASLPSRQRRGQIDWRTGLSFAAVASLGAWGGSWLNARAPEHLLMAALAALLCCVSFAMLRSGLRQRREEDRERLVRRDEQALDGQLESTSETPDGNSDGSGLAASAVADSSKAPNKSSLAAKVHPAKTILSALGTGSLTGFFGVGGGFAVVPVLTMILRLDIRRASGTSLLIMVITSIVSLAQRATGPISLDVRTVAIFALCSAAGGVIGGPLSQRARPSTLTLLFAALLAAIAIRTSVSLF